MKTPHLCSALGLCLGLLGHSLVAGPIPVGKLSAYPAWWFERDVIPRLPAAANKTNPAWPTDYAEADDYAAANIGQLKSIFSKAAAELNAAIPEGGAGSSIDALLATWQSPPATGVPRDDFAAVNQGQLKATVHVIYRRLRQIGYFGPPLKGGSLYPWGETGAEDAYSLVNLGQVKHVFSFFSAPLYLDAYLADTDLDGMPNGWESERGLNPIDPNDASQMTGGLTNLAIYQQFQLGGGDPATGNPVGLLVYSP